MSNADLRVRIQRNDGSETFRLKASRVETSVENNVATDSIISGASRALAGGKLVLGLQRYQITIVIQGTEPGDYPNSATHTDDDKGMRDELLRASKTFGFTVADGFDKLLYDGRQIDGVFTGLDITEDTGSRPARTYEASIEWTHLDAFVS